MSRNNSSRTRRNSGRETEAIVMSLLRKQIEKTAFLALLLICVGGIYSIGLILNVFIVLKINIEILIAIGVILIALFLRLKLLRYRIIEGYYGNNLYEAKEIIKFIDEENDDEGSSGGNSGNKTVFPQTVESSEQTREGWKGGLEGETT
jgi:hypothetical protein